MFRTELNIEDSHPKISLKHRLITVGSCFSDTIGHRLHTHKFNVMSNPFGTVFNPLSIFKLIHKSLNGTQVTEQELIKNGEVYYHYDFHSDFSHTSPTLLVEKINEQLGQFQARINDADYLILTFGTAWVYTHKESKEIASNCHKMPSQLFDRSLLSSKRILKEFESLLMLLQSINPELDILVTVSPVRHTRDGLEQNQVSKSTLRLAAHYLQQTHDRLRYFPSYELLLDDLRDYRYYRQDLIHPSEEAVDYVWGKFQQAYFDDVARKFIPKWNLIQKALNHQAFHPNTQAHQDFIKKTLAQLKELSQFVNVAQEMEQLKKQLIQ